jgi:hypothetical protein
MLASVARGYYSRSLKVRIDHPSTAGERIPLSQSNNRQIAEGNGADVAEPYRW